MLKVAALSLSLCELQEGAHPHRADELQNDIVSQLSPSVQCAASTTLHGQLACWHQGAVSPKYIGPQPLFYTKFSEERVCA